MEVDPGSAHDRLQRALTAAARDGDAPTRAQAAARSAEWRALLEGRHPGAGGVGPRTARQDVPDWVTPEVEPRGSTAGPLPAEQPLDADEQELLSSLGEVPGSTDRERLNLWHLGDDGQRTLLEQLSSGGYRIDLPEHAALAVVALLVDEGRADDALDLAVVLRPVLPRLRLTPVPTAAPQPGGTTLHVQTTGAVAQALEAARDPEQVRRLRDALVLWAPLYDELVALWSQAFEGEVPDWVARREAWLRRYAVAVTSSHPGRHARRDSTFGRLHTALLTCPGSPGELAPRDVPRVHAALAASTARHGAPGSPELLDLRARQAAEAQALQGAALARAVGQRLRRLPPGAGLLTLDDVLADVGPDELPGLAAPRPVPPQVARKVARALEAPVPELAVRGVLPSPEALGRLLPQVLAPYLSAGLARPDATALHARTCAAFRRRRSPLRADPQDQVRCEELPWVRALRVVGAPTDVEAGHALAALREVVLLLVTGWPQSIVPNPLLIELGALARQAGLRLPLTEELATEAFTGTFTATWRAAATVASRQLAGTLYARYYDLPESWAPVTPRPARLFARFRGEPRPAPAPVFTLVCTERAEQAGARGRSWDVASSDAVLEQSQVLTTHNLAVLLDGLQLEEQVRALAPELAARALDHAVRTGARLPRQPRGQRRAVMSVACAWRQAVYLLSLCTPQEQERQAAALVERTQGTRLLPAAQGLAHVVAGGRFGRDGQAVRGSGRRLLGWTVGRHWLLAPDPG